MILGYWGIGIFGNCEGELDVLRQWENDERQCRAIDEQCLLLYP
jgi:hypothetical protein